MKIMNLSKVAENETEILTRLDHKNIVKYFDHFEIIMSNNRIRGEKKLCIVTEFCDV